MDVLLRMEERQIREGERRDEEMRVMRNAIEKLSSSVISLVEGFTQQLSESLSADC